jgi:exopolysaccharide production protein ExoQ
MNPQIATVAYILLIAGLFWLDRERKVRTSWALWIPALWLLINGSRPVSSWFETGRTIAVQNLEGSPLDAAVFGALLLGALGVLVWRRRRVGRFLRANAPILLFFTYCAASILWADYPFVAFKRWIKAVGDVAMVLVVLTDLNPTAAIQRVLSRMGFILLPLSVLFIKYYPDIGRGYNPWTWLPSYGGVTVFKNLLGMTCLIAGLGSVWSFMTAYRTRKNADGSKNKNRMRHLAAHGIVIGMAIYLFLIADSMTSFSCFLLGGFLIVIASGTRLGRKPAVIHTLVAVMVGLSLSVLFLPESGLVQSLGRDPTLTGRTAIWTAVISLVRHPLLGAGFESFWTGDRLTRVWLLIKEPGIQEAHNGYLEVYLNLGWIGVSLLALVIVAGYRDIIAMFHRDRDAGTIRLAFFVVGLIYSCTEAGFRMMSVVWIAFLLAATAAPQMRKRNARAPVDLTSDNKVSTENLTAETTPAYEDVFEAI